MIGLLHIKCGFTGPLLHGCGYKFRRRATLFSQFHDEFPRLLQQNLRVTAFRRTRGKNGCAPTIYDEQVQTPADGDPAYGAHHYTLGSDQSRHRPPQVFVCPRHRGNLQFFQHGLQRHMIHKPPYQSAFLKRYFRPQSQFCVQVFTGQSLVRPVCRLTQQLRQNNRERQNDPRFVFCKSLPVHRAAHGRKRQGGGNSRRHTRDRNGDTGRKETDFRGGRICSLIQV